jgi:spore coat protein A, manganese oxidase
VLFLEPTKVACILTFDPFFKTRRTFLQQVSALGLAWGAQSCFAQPAPHAMEAMVRGAGVAGTPPPPRLRCDELAPFVDALPIPVTARMSASGKLRIAMREVRAKVHRDVAPTRMWSYWDLASGEGSALAPVLEARSSHPLHVEWVNELPAKHFLPVDFSLHGCGHDVPEVRACVHLHGGRTPPKDDGQPEDWFAPGQSRLCTYPLQQDAATLWYHDHAMGLNRLNMYAGLLGMAIVRDATEVGLHLPSGKYEVPLTLYDRLFSADGQLYYPDSGDPEHPWVSEFAGDAILINGKIFPYFEVEPRLYRFRILNAANSRFFSLALTEGGPFHQIGSDQGLLAAPVKLASLGVAPAERADVLIDFSGAAGKTVHLVNGGVKILEFRVGRDRARSSARNAPSAATIPTTLRSVIRTPEASATLTRTIGLTEYFDKTGNSMLMLLNRKRWHEPVTETPKLGTTEIWEFANTTEDTHPLHLHLVRFQVLDRRVFDVFGFRNNKGLHYLAPAMPPEANEMGWKDTVQCPAGVVTRIVVRFEGYAGRYLYHCHILEHEANEMMRPFEVVG